MSHGMSIHFRPWEGRAPRRASSFRTTISRSAWDPVTGHGRHGCSLTHPRHCQGVGGVPLLYHSLRGSPPPRHSHPSTRGITLQTGATSFKTWLRGTRLLRPHYAESASWGVACSRGHGSARDRGHAFFWALLGLLGHTGKQRSGRKPGLRQIRESSAVPAEIRILKVASKTPNVTSVFISRVSSCAVFPRKTERDS